MSWRFGDRSRVQMKLGARNNSFRRTGEKVERKVETGAVVH